MALADLNAYNAALANPNQQIGWVKVAALPNQTGGGSQWVSTWTHSPNAGAVPTTGATCDRTTTGALGQFNAATELRMLLSELSSMNTAQGVATQTTLMIADRLCHMGGLDSTLLTAQTVNTPTVPRYTPATDRLMMGYETYGLAGTTAQTFTVSYTNQSGTAGQTSQPVLIGGTSVLNQPSNFMSISLAAGDAGVSSVQTATMAASTGTAGNFGITIYKPLLMVPMISFLEEMQRFDPIQRLGAMLPLVQPGACLWMLVRSNGANTNNINIQANLKFIED